MCCTPHDYRISGYVDRYDDYRGFDPMYRAGSVFGRCAYQTVIGDAYYVGSGGDFYTNAGNYGITTPISTVRRSPSHTFVPQPDTPKELIGIPDYTPGNGSTIIVPVPENSNNRIPTTQELIERQRGMIPMPLPVTPPLRPKVVPMPSDNPSGEVIPFSPSDEQIAPPSPLPTILETDSPITLEELRRLDPSIKDMQIISIEDASVEALLR
jgi:hypothetical protein